MLYTLPPPQEKRGQATPLTDQLCECIQAKLLSIIRPPPKLVYFIHDPKSLSLLNQLHVGLSKPYFNKFKYKFGKTLNLLCTINGSVEDTQHYFLLCHTYDVFIRDLLSSADSILLPHDITGLSNQKRLKVIFHGYGQLPFDSTATILRATLEYISLPNVLNDLLT